MTASALIMRKLLVVALVNENESHSHFDLALLALAVLLDIKKYYFDSPFCRQNDYNPFVRIGGSMRSII